MMADTNVDGDANAIETPSWERAHQMLVGLARTRAGFDLEEGKWLVAAARERVDRRLGYASFVEYVERLFGYAPRLTQEKLRVAEALEQLPELAAALARSETNWSSVRELTRVALPSTEKVWLDAARGRTVRDVERLVSGRVRGSLPTDPADERLRRHVLRFEVSGEVLAAFRDAIRQLRRDAGGTLDDDAVLLLMARHVLGGPQDEGRASYQIELSVCEDCRRARQQRGGEVVEVAPQVADMAHCDAQRMSSEEQRMSSEEQRTSSEEQRMSSEEQSTSAHVGGRTPGRGRATQTIPPALRRAILRRDRRRCRVPGCRHATFLDLHHVRSREEGGEHQRDNLVTLCGAHHRAAHDGELVIEGRVATGLRFKHADGSDYGAVMNVATTGAQTRAFQALRQLGFTEREARLAVAEALERVEPEADTETRLRVALDVLTAGAYPRAS